MWARAAASAAVSMLPSLPGTTGTPAACMRRRAADLLPMASITSPEGPMKVMPQSAHSRANSLFSLRKPKPGWMASQPVLTAAVRMAWALR